MSWLFYWQWVYPFSIAIGWLIAGWTWNWEFEYMVGDLIISIIPFLNTLYTGIGLILWIDHHWNWSRWGVFGRNKPKDHSHKMKGFTLIELLIVIAIIGIIASVALTTSRDGTTCRGGYKFIYNGQYAGYRQLLDEHGHGIKCGSNQ